jgi:hypothetical protein
MPDRSGGLLASATGVLVDAVAARLAQHVSERAFEVAAVEHGLKVSGFEWHGQLEHSLEGDLDAAHQLDCFAVVDGGDEVDVVVGHMQGEQPPVAPRIARAAVRSSGAPRAIVWSRSKWELLDSAMGVMAPSPDAIGRGRAISGETRGGRPNARSGAGHCEG